MVARPVTLRGGAAAEEASRDRASPPCHARSGAVGAARQDRRPSSSSSTGHRLCHSVLALPAAPQQQDEILLCCRSPYNTNTRTHCCCVLSPANFLNLPGLFSYDLYANIILHNINTIHLYILKSNANHFYLF